MVGLLVGLMLVGIATVNATPKVEESAWNDLLQVGGDINIKSNDVKSARSDGSLEDHIETYIKNHEVSFDLPIIGSKKIFVPILIFILIKAMTLIPLALGVLGIKAWNAIQLSFVSFVSALAMAVWKLCSKVHHEPPQIIHNAWDSHAHLHHDRSDVAQQMAYGGQ
ncbi:unnamed protein product [Phaedon cochleariae]|uniref:Uncharacterized protein n=1 Tax=Phaedon cochleariae TaxID=80249 RepID=A0A9N9SCK8_PHACE|nr:unnamed protein product [Phaedon cochleariae]